RLAHRDRADGRTLDLVVGHGRPRLAAVHRLPEAAADRAEVRLLRASAHATHGDRASTAIRADRAPAIRCEERAVDRRSRYPFRTRLGADVCKRHGQHRDKRRTQRQSETSRSTKHPEVPWLSEAPRAFATAAERA